MSSKAETMTITRESTITPELRFPEFMDGDGWQSPQLSDLYGFKRTNTLSRDKLNYDAGTIRNIHYGDIHTKFKPLFRVEDEYVPYINADVSGANFREDDDCEEGDIVIADASEDLNDVGKAIEIISLDGQRVVAGTHTILASRRGNIPVLGFGGHLFQCRAVREGIQRESQGAKVYGISASRISTVRLPIPPTREEQQKIADCLSSLDRLIGAEERKLRALSDHKRGLMQQLFPQPGDAHPRLRFPEFRDSGDWQEKELSAITPAIFDGTHQTPTYTEAGIPFYSVENLISGNANKFISKEDYDLATKKNKPEKGDILLTRIGRVGYSQVVTWDHEFSVYVTLAVIKRSQKFNSHYLHFFMQSEFYQEELRSKSLSNAVPPKINMDSLRETKVLIPSPTEQQRIADCLIALDAQITAQKCEIDALKQHKGGLMQQLFPVQKEQ